MGLDRGRSISAASASAGAPMGSSFELRGCTVAATAVRRAVAQISLVHRIRCRMRSAAWSVLGIGVKRRLTHMSSKTAPAGARGEWHLRTALALEAATLLTGALLQQLSLPTFGERGTEFWKALTSMIESGPGLPSCPSLPMPASWSPTSQAALACQTSYNKTGSLERSRYRATLWMANGELKSMYPRCVRMLKNCATIMKCAIALPRSVCTRKVISLSGNPATPFRFGH
mmetsp:Transcript_30780/g.67513  ORF Transcript_30780/g.67513 Transcript_30780/m.67513 type:complete len:230 (-) Transcript_30780:1398-2087(-)